MAEKKIIRVLNEREAELVRLNSRVLEESPDLIAIVGRDFLCHYVNPAYAAIHGRKREDFIGFPVRRFLGDDVFESVVKPNLDRCMSGEDIHYEDWFDFGESGVQYMDVRYLPLRGDDGTVDRIVVVSRNITYRKEAEETRMYREKLQTVLELAGTYNHEINNPLCALGGFIEILALEETDGKRLEYIEKARAEIQRIAEVTRKIQNMTALRQKDYAGGTQILSVDEENGNDGR